MTDEAAALLQKLRCARYRGFRDGNDTVTLTHEELLILLGMLPRPRKHNLKLARRDKNMAALVALYEADGLATEPAVAKVKEHYGMSRAKIFEAMKDYPMGFLKRLPAEMRAEWISRYESQQWKLDIDHYF